MSIKTAPPQPNAGAKQTKFKLIYVYTVYQMVSWMVQRIPLKTYSQSQHMQAGRPIEKVRKLRSNQLDLKSPPPKKIRPAHHFTPFLKYSPQLALITSPQRPQMFAFVPGHRKSVSFMCIFAKNFPPRCPVERPFQRGRGLSSTPRSMLLRLYPWQLSPMVEL